MLEPGGWPEGASGNGGGPSTLDYAFAICERECAAGCYLDEQDPGGCEAGCGGIFVGASMDCPAETETYVDCLGNTEPIYFCPDYGEGSPCYTEATAMIACVRGL